MTTGRRTPFINLAPRRSWASPRELWKYFWVVYRVAEPRHERTKAADAFIALMEASERPNDSWSFTGDAVVFQRLALYDVVSQSVRKPNSNFLIETKPPNKYLRTLALGTTFLPTPLVFIDNVSLAWQDAATLGALFGADDQNIAAWQEHFGSDSPPSEYCGVPLIGWTRQEVWFGVTPYRSLWAEPPDVRAASLKFPLRPVSQLLRLPWSPVDDNWSPIAESQFDTRTVDSLDFTSIARNSRTGCLHPTREQPA